MSKFEWRAVFFHIPLLGSDVPLSCDGDFTAMMLNLLRRVLNGSCTNSASLAVLQSSMKLSI